MSIQSCVFKMFLSFSKCIKSLSMLWYALLTKESMKHLEESRRPKLIQRSGSVQWEKRKTYWSSWVQPLSPAVRPGPGLLHCPGFAGHKSSFLSKLPAPLRRRRPAGWEALTLHLPLPCLNPSLARREADGASRMALDCTCTGGFPALPPLQLARTHTCTHTNPQTRTLFLSLWVSIRWPTNSPRLQRL